MQKVNLIFMIINLNLIMRKQMIKVIKKIKIYKQITAVKFLIRLIKINQN